MHFIKLSASISFLAAIASCAEVPPSPPSSEDSKAITVLRDEWIPALEQICSFFEERYDAGLEQQFTAANIGWARDAQMLIAYVHLWQCLGSEERTKLLREQEAWRRKAEQEMEKAGKEYEGGSLESTLASKTYGELALKRTQALRLRLKAIRGASYVDPGPR